MKSFVLSALVFSSALAFAKPDCSNSSAIEKAAIKQAKIANSSKEAAVQAISYSLTTKDGKKDKYVVQMTVNEECDAQVIIYTDVDTCDPVNAVGGQLGDGACG